MIEGKFDVVFRGQIVKGRELSDVKNNLVQLFKSSLIAVEPLFSGEDIKIKRSLDYTTAMKYQSALKQAGALAIISEIMPVKPKANFLIPEDDIETSTSETATSTDSTISNANTFVNEVTEDNSSKMPSIERAALVIPPKTVNKLSEPNEGNLIEEEMTMAEVGSQILPDKIYEKRDVDTSDLSLASVGERILPPKAPETHPQPSTDHLSLE